MSELYSRSTGESASALVPASCPPRLSQVRGDLLVRVPTDRYRVVGLQVYASQAGQVSERSIADRAGDAVAYVAGYGRSRQVIRTERSLGHTDRTTILLAGDYLQGLAYEAIAALDTEDATVQRCLDACTRATERLCQRWTANDGDAMDDPNSAVAEAAGFDTHSPAVAGTLVGFAGELGAILGGASQDSSLTIRERGRALGPSILRGDRRAVPRLTGSDTHDHAPTEGADDAR